MSAEDKKKTGDPSAPTIEELDSAWDENGPAFDEHGEEFDEDATTVQRIPKELVALSRRGTEIEQPAKKEETPEKHEAITARPPPGPVEPSMVIDAPHEELPQAPDLSSPVDIDDDDDLDEEEEDDEPDADAIDNEWGEIEERAAAADAAAGLSPEARKQAADKRAAARREKARAKTRTAKEKRRAHVDSQRLKAKKPKRRSSSHPPKEDREASTERRPKPSAPPKESSGSSARPAPMTAASGAPMVVAPKNDVLRMVFLVAMVVLVGALVIGLARR